MSAAEAKTGKSLSVRYIVTGVFETVRPEIALQSAASGDRPSDSTYTIELVPDPSDESFTNGTVLRLGFPRSHPFETGKRVTLTVSLD